MFKFLTGLFGASKSEKDVKVISPLVAIINNHFESYKSLSNDQLRGKTAEFKERIKEHLVEIDNSIKALNEQAEQLPVEDILGRDDLYKAIDELKKKRNQQIEEILEKILPEAFAVVKEAGRRFKEHETLAATATDLDRELSVKKDYVKINGDESVFQTSLYANLKSFHLA
jgi:preprotein translocase subunit SecA